MVAVLKPLAKYPMSLPAAAVILGTDLDAIRRLLRRHPSVDAGITRVGRHRVLTEAKVEMLRKLIGEEE